MMRRRWQVDLAVGWVLLAVLGAIVALVAAFIWWQATDRDEALEARVRQVCDQYASLDLSGLAQLCMDVGYQPRVIYVQPTGTAAWWPTIYRPMQPEDLDR